MGHLSPEAKTCSSPRLRSAPRSPPDVRQSASLFKRKIAGAGCQGALRPTVRSGDAR